MTEDSFEKSFADMLRRKKDKGVETGGTETNDGSPAGTGGEATGEGKGLIGRFKDKVLNTISGRKPDGPEKEGASETPEEKEQTEVPPAGGSVEQNDAKVDDAGAVLKEGEGQPGEVSADKPLTAVPPGGEQGENNEGGIHEGGNNDGGTHEGEGQAKGKGATETGGEQTGDEGADGEQLSVETEGTGGKTEGTGEENSAKEDTPDDLRRKYYESKAKAFLNSLPVEDASSVADTYFRGARTLVNAMLLHPHAISSASRILGTAFATAEATSRLAANTAKKYSRVAGKDPEIVKNTLMYKLYKRKQDQDKVVVENAYKTMDDALKQAGVDDYRQMTGDQLVDYLGILSKSRDSMADTLKKGTNPDGTPISREDRQLLKSQLDIVGEHADKVYKQYNRISPYERRMDAEVTRQTNARIRAEKQKQRLAEKQAKQAAKDAEKQFYADQDAESSRRWTEATDKTGYGDILRGAFEKPVELGYDGTPLNKKDANHLRRHIADSKSNLEVSLNNMPVGSEEWQEANDQLDKLKEYEQLVLRRNPHFSGAYDRQDVLQGKLDEQSRIAATVDNLRTSNPNVYNTLYSVYGKKPREVDEHGIPVNANDRASLFNKLTGSNGEVHGASEDYLLSLAGSIGPRALERFKGKIDKQKLDEAIRQSRENIDKRFRESIKNWIVGSGNGSTLDKLRFDSNGIPESDKGRSFLIGKLKENPGIIPDLEDRCEYMMQVAGNNGELKQTVLDYYTDQRRREYNKQYYDKSGYRDVFDVISADGDIDVDEEGHVAPSSFKKLEQSLKDAIRATFSDKGTSEYYEQALEHFRAENKDLTDKAKNLGNTYGGVFERIASVSPGFNEKKIEEVIKNNNWGSAQAHTQIMKAVSSYIDDLRKQVSGYDKNGNPIFENDPDLAKNYKIAMAVQRAVNLSDIKDDFTNTVRSLMRQYNGIYSTDSEEGLELLRQANGAYKKWLGGFGLNNIKEFKEYDGNEFPDTYPVKLSRVLARGKNKGEFKAEKMTRPVAENRYKDELAAILTNFIASKMPKDETAEAEKEVEGFKRKAEKKLRTKKGGESSKETQAAATGTNDAVKEVLGKYVPDGTVVEGENPKEGQDTFQTNLDKFTGTSEGNSVNEDENPQAGAGKDLDENAEDGANPEKGGEENPETGVAENPSVEKNKDFVANAFKRPKKTENNWRKYRDIVLRHENGDKYDKDGLKEELKKTVYTSIIKGVYTPLSDKEADELVNELTNKRNNEKAIERARAKKEKEEENKKNTQKANLESAINDNWITKITKPSKAVEYHIDSNSKKYIDWFDKQFKGSEPSINNLKKALAEHLGVTKGQLRFPQKKPRRLKDANVPPKIPKQEEDEVKNIESDSKALDDDSNLDSPYNVIAGILNGKNDSKLIRRDNSLYFAESPEDAVKYALIQYFASPNYTPRSKFLQGFKERINDAIKNNKQIFDGEEGAKYKAFFEDKAQSLAKNMRENYWVDGNSDGSKTARSDNGILADFIKQRKQVTNADIHNQKMRIFREISGDDGTKYPDVNQSDIDSQINKDKNESNAGKDPFAQIKSALKGGEGLQEVEVPEQNDLEQDDERYDGIKNKYSNSKVDFDYLIGENKLTQKDVADNLEEYFELAKTDGENKQFIDSKHLEDDALDDKDKAIILKDALKLMGADKKKRQGAFEPIVEDVPKSPRRNIPRGRVTKQGLWDIVYYDKERPEFKDEYFDEKKHPDIKNRFMEGIGLPYKAINELMLRKPELANDINNKLKEMWSSGKNYDELKKEDLTIDGINLRNVSADDIERKYPGKHVITSDKKGRFDWTKEYIKGNSRPYFNDAYLKDDGIMNVFLRNTGLQNRDFLTGNNKNIFAQDIKNQMDKGLDYQSAMANTYDAIKSLWNSDLSDRYINSELNTKIKDGNATTYGDLIKKGAPLKDVVDKMLFYADIGNRDKALRNFGNLSEDTYQAARHYFEKYEHPSVNPKRSATNTYEFLKPLYDEYIKDSNNQDFDKYIRDKIQTLENGGQNTNSVKKSSSKSVDGFLYDAWSKHDGSYEKLTSILGPESFAKGGLMASAKSLDDMYDIILHNVGADCAESFGRHFID